MQDLSVINKVLCVEVRDRIKRTKKNGVIHLSVPPDCECGVANQSLEGSSCCHGFVCLFPWCYELHACQTMSHILCVIIQMNILGIPKLAISTLFKPIPVKFVHLGLRANDCVTNFWLQGLVPGMHSIQAGTDRIFIAFLVESNDKECFFSLFKGCLSIRSEIREASRNVLCVKKKKRDTVR